jgi:hypothetical protein
MEKGFTRREKDRKMINIGAKLLVVIERLEAKTSVAFIERLTKGVEQQHGRSLRVR